MQYGRLDGQLCSYLKPFSVYYALENRLVMRFPEYYRISKRKQLPIVHMPASGQDFVHVSTVLSSEGEQIMSVFCPSIVPLSRTGCSYNTPPGIGLSVVLSDSCDSGHRNASRFQSRGISFFQCYSFTKWTIAL